ncbi:MAG: NAD(P)/FAD-dependent oxidoreductase [Acidimicrobiales bacterium]|nr:NAD(P)/FAD-dependent oxidoreductase [Acidimicrobiales bacterium]
MTCERKHKVVVVGSGFGGLAAAKALSKRSSRSSTEADVEVTLVDRNNFHTFQPLLYQVATSGLNAADIAHPVRGIFHDSPGVSFVHAAVTGADLERGIVHLDGTSHPVDDVPFDDLVVAAGATTNTFGTPGVEEHGFPLYNLADATALRNHVLERFEAADVAPDLIDDGALTFVVVGGGPTGVEVAGALAELFSMVLRKDFKHLDVGRARVVLVEMLPQLLGPFSDPSRRHAREALEERGVEVRVEEQVERVEATRVVLAGGEEIPAHTLIWAAGVKANPLGALLGLPTVGSGRIEVGPDLNVTGHPNVWAVGDIAASIDARTDQGPLPQLAPVAMQGGVHVAEQIRRRIDGLPTVAFRYRDKGTMATIGRSHAVAELPLRIRLRGFPAWVAWLALHLVMLAGFRNRVSVFVNWAWNWFTWDRGPRVIFGGEGATRARASDRP